MISCLFLDTDERRHFSDEARRAIHEVCAGADAELHRLLPSLPEEIEVCAQTGTFVIQETGELGSAIAARRVYWTVDPSRPGGVAATALAQLRYTLFHEFHHLARGWFRMGREHRARFIEGAICEGLASAFERDAAGRDAPWAKYPPDVNDWVGEIARLPRSANYRHWMFQHPDGRRWIGYRAGTFIADRAIAATGRSAAELATASADDILRYAGVATER
jgi:hypothetical protein